MLAIQATFPPADTSTAMAILFFIQSFGGSIFLTLAGVISSAGLRDQIPRFAPNVDPETVIAAGATGFRGVVDPEDLEGVLQAYARSLDWVFFLVAGVAAVQFLASWGMGWVDVRKKGDGTGGEEEGGGEEAGVSEQKGGV